MNSLNMDEVNNFFELMDETNETNDFPIFVEPICCVVFEPDTVDGDELWYRTYEDILLDFEEEQLKWCDINERYYIYVEGEVNLEGWIVYNAGDELWFETYEDILKTFDEDRLEWDSENDWYKVLYDEYNDFEDNYVSFGNSLRDTDAEDMVSMGEDAPER